MYVTPDWLKNSIKACNSFFLNIVLTKTMLLVRLSLQSHSSGSLDSMLNVSNDDERTHDSINNDQVFVTPPNSDLVGMNHLVFNVYTTF